MKRLMILLLAAILSAAGCQKSPQPSTLTVFAAASLTAPFNDLKPEFESKYPGVSVTFNFGGSNDLRMQIEQSAPADVFCSANQKEMKALVDAAAVDQSTVQIFGRNRLTIIVPKSNPAHIQSLADLGKPDVKLIVADPAVPVGAYLMDLLKRADAQPNYGSDFSQRVLANIRSKEENVKAVVAKISLGEGDAGIAYVSDLHGAGSENLTGIDLPSDINPLAEYPIGIIKRSATDQTAQEFETFLCGPDGQDTLRKYGFITTESK